MEAAIMQELNDMTTAETVGATTRKSGTTFEEIVNAIGGSLSDLASSDDEEDGEDDEDDEEDTQLGKLCDDDEPGWVMSTISNTVQHGMVSFRQRKTRLDKLTQPGWGDAANYFGERDMKYETAKLNVPAVVKSQLDMTAATPSLTTFGEDILTLDVIGGQSQMLPVTSRPGSIEMRLGSEKPQLHKFILVLSHDLPPDSTPIQDAKPVKPITFYPCIKHH